MLQIFVWTVTFALLSVFFGFALGLLLASVLQWPHLRGKAVYRILLILPYAVPAFISILVFRGLFNQNFGEINLILKSLFGIQPQWFTDATLARTMLIMVNVWLGYPYMMLLAMGYLQSIPQDHYKAAALEGSGVLRNFFSITLPQILPPFVPLLISSFAFNFNNVVLILLLTRGAPDIAGTIVPAGQTDILGSFTFRVSFQDAGQNFGIAGAISTLIFLLVGRPRLRQLLCTATRRRSAREGLTMIVERPRELFWKKVAAHAFLISFIALILFPFLIVLSISLRPGNFSTGSLIPNPISFEHWSLALRHSLHRRRRHGDAAALPGAAVAVQLDQDRLDRLGRHPDPLDDGGLCVLAPALPRPECHSRHAADRPDVPGRADGDRALYDL